MSDNDKKNDNVKCNLYSELECTHERSIDIYSDRVLDKIDVLDSRLDKVETHLAIYNEQLKVHIKGVQEMHKENKLLKENIDNNYALAQSELNKRFQPVNSHIKKVDTYIRAIILLISIMSFVLLGLNLYSKIMSI